MIQSLRPRSIILLTVLLAVLMVGSALLELSQSREELLHLITEEALSLIGTIERSSVNIVLSSDQIESEISKRLLNNAFFIAQLDSQRRLSAATLNKICASNNIFRINIIDGSGRKVMGSHSPLYGRAMMPQREGPSEILRPLLNKTMDTLIIGLRTARFSDDQRFAVAIRRRVPEGGAIVLNIDVALFADLRRAIGLGKMMKDLGTSEGIEYAVLQDDEGIIAAGGAVTDLSTVREDSGLRIAQETDTTVTRIASVGDREVLEAIRALRVGREYLGLIRIGLSMNEVRATETRKQRRLWILTIVLFGLSALVAVTIGALQHARATRERIHQVETYTGKILEHMNDAVITIDASSSITMCNPQVEKLFGTSASSLIGRSLHQEEWPFNQIRTLFEEGPPLLNVNPTWPDGSIRYLSISRSFEHRSDGTAERATVVIRDVTEARRLEQQIRDQERFTAMGELAAGVAHEIRNPLNAIAMIAQRFLKEFKPVRGVKEYRSIAGVLLDESRRVNGIIQQFLRFARPAVPHPTVVDLTSFAEHVLAMIHPDARDRQIRVRSEISDVAATFDRDLMTQAVLNLLRNALEATPKKGTVSLVITDGPEDVRIVVHDSGSGIPREARETVFQPYISTKTSGTDLGLAITRQIVEAHGGTIEVLEAPGGSFLITLPKR